MEKRKRLKYLFLTLIVGVYCYIHVYIHFIYLSDQKIKNYLIKNQQAFNELIESKRQNCGKYFKLLENSRIEGKSTYIYTDTFLKDSPESQSFLKKHRLVTEMYDNTWQPHNSNLKLSEQPKSEGAEHQQAIVDCQSIPHITFKLKETPYIGLKFFNLTGPHIVEKRIIYAPNPASTIAHDWDYYQKHTKEYDAAFDYPYFDPNIEARKHIKSGLRRASNSTSDEFIIHCKSATRDGFTKIQDNWYIYADDGIRHTECRQNHWFWGPLVILIYPLFF